MSFSSVMKAIFPNFLNIGEGHLVNTERILNNLFLFWLSANEL